MKWSRERIEDCAAHYKACDVCQREGFTPLFSWHRFRRNILDKHQ